MSVQPEWIISAWPRWTTLSIGLITLSLFLVAVRFRDGSIVRPIRERRLYRVVLALISGWLSAWFLLPFDFIFPIPETRGFFVPGAIFGALVAAPVLNSPARRPLLVALMVWIGAVAYALIWLSGMLAVELISRFISQIGANLEDLSEGVEGSIEAVLVGALPGMVFGILVNLGLSNASGRRSDWRTWLSIVAISGICGVALASVVLDVWSESFDLVERYTFEDSPIFLVHALWYAVFALTVDRYSQRSIRGNASVSPWFLGTLLSLTILVVWSLGLEHYPYEWFAR